MDPRKVILNDKNILLLSSKMKKGYIIQRTNFSPCLASICPVLLMRLQRRSDGERQHIE